MIGALKQCLQCPRSGTAILVRFSLNNVLTFIVKPDNQTDIKSYILLTLVYSENHCFNPHIPGLFLYL